MIFKFFKKDHTHYREKGDRLFEEGRYAEARHEYEDALRMIKPDSASEISAYLNERIREAGNQLALLNMQEAVHQLHSGNLLKATEHAELAFEQAEDDTIRGNATDFLSKIQIAEPPAPPQSKSHSCSSCSGAHHQTDATTEISTDFLPFMDRFELLVQPLPGDLPDRYRELGERFAYAYIAIHDDRIEEGYSVLKELSRQISSDILDYELAIIDFQNHRLAECENRLNSAISLNSDNPLCHLALVQLMVETGRLPRAVELLEMMVNSGHLADQALIMLGDVKLMMGDAAGSLEIFVKALDIPAVAKTAAQKAIPILENMGRVADAKAVSKRYLKGCC